MKRSIYGDNFYTQFILHLVFSDELVIVVVVVVVGYFLFTYSKPKV